MLTLTEHVNRLDEHIETQAQACEYSAVINALMCLRGIQTTTAFGLTAEIGDFTRFTGATIASYVGLTPSEYSSGTKRVQGPRASAKS